MKKEIFWKHFNLGKELSVSGNFIYDGLKSLDQAETLHYEDEIFQFLYYISVGIERLAKIAIILTEHDSVADQEDFEKSLITHNHSELIRRLSNNHKINLGKNHNKFLQLISKFYKTMRYDRYNLEDCYKSSKEKDNFLKFLSESLNIKIIDEFPFNVARNNEKRKRFVGETVGKITYQLYEIIKKESTRLGIYTNEIRSNSKAEKIFIRKEYNFSIEKILINELLVYLINTKDKSGLLDFMRAITPLEFDPALAKDYLISFHNNQSTLGIMGELESLYEETVDNKKERLERINIPGDPSVFL